MFIWVTSFTLGIVPSVLSGRSFKFYDNSHVCVGLPLALRKIFTTQEFRQNISTILPVNTNAFATNFTDHDVTRTYIKATFFTEENGLTSGLYFSSVVFLGLNCVCFLVILTCYITIVNASKKSAKKVGRTRHLKEQLTLTSKVTSIIATDFCCWFPIVVLGILVQSRAITLSPSAYAWSIAVVLPINSAINPYLYTIAEMISKKKKK